MSDLSKAVVRSGAVDASMLAELAHWKLPVTVPEEAPFASAEEAVAAIEDAQEEDAQVEIRVTDPGLLKQYEATKQPGKLKVVINEEQSQAFGWDYGRTLLGEYILAWTSTVSTELLVNGMTYLLTSDKQRVYFTNTQDIYVGDEKKFVVCTPRK
jgi:hypothetical protein